MTAMSEKISGSAEKALPWVLLVSGLVGFAASFVLTIDKMKLLANPHFAPACNLNPIISCGSVMKTGQASVFGFANSLVGIAAFAVLAFLGMSLLAGARYRRWFWLAIQAGAALGLAFVGWLIFQSLYRIHSLCPYCMGVWAATIATFWYVLVHNLRTGYMSFGVRARDFLVRNHAGMLLALYAVVAALVLQHFWYFFNPFK